MSGTVVITIRNVGKTNATLELGILFAKALDQTGQIVAGAGLGCTGASHGPTINANLVCTGGQLGPGEATTVTVQGRGQAAGGGTLTSTLNNSRAVDESNYANNVKQLNVNIN